MSSGSNYVQAPYEAVNARSISTFSATIPSGATIVSSVYYMWNDQGFTGGGWHSDLGGSPTNMAIAAGIIPTEGFNNNEDAVEAYIIQYQNLNAVFSYWAQHYTMQGWDDFYTAVGAESGCMDVVHS